MNRRRFLCTCSVGLLAAPRAAETQQPRKMSRVGWLSSFGGPRPTFRQAMNELGYVEGKSVTFEIRAAEGRYDRIPHLTAELISTKVDIIVAVAPAAIQAAKHATSSVPIVMAYWGGPDLLETGVIASFARPGGNVTGVHMLASALDPKRLELLVQAVPGAKKVAVLAQERAVFERQLTGLRKVAPGLGVDLYVAEVADAKGYEAAFESMTRMGAHGLLVPTSVMFGRDRQSIIELAARRRIPAIYDSGLHAVQAGLMGYGPTLAEMDRQAAKFVDKILKGAAPADLPVEQPTKFELVINLKTAQALGLTIPQSLLLRADQVLE